MQQLGNKILMSLMHVSNTKWPLELKLVWPHCKIAKNSVVSLEFTTCSQLPMTIWVVGHVDHTQNSIE